MTHYRGLVLGEPLLHKTYTTCGDVCQYNTHKKRKAKAKLVW